MSPDSAGTQRGLLWPPSPCEPNVFHLLKEIVSHVQVLDAGLVEESPKVRGLVPCR